MSRKKKSRKPASAPIAKPKLSKQELENIEKRVRKRTGKQPGNRQQEAKSSSKQHSKEQRNKDPRLGSKKPIELGALANKAEKQAVKTKDKSLTPLAAVRPVKSDELSPEQALIAIEQDEALQLILAKQEDDIELTEQEVDYYNDMMDKHAQLSQALGLDDSEDEEAQSQVRSEEELWQKLDGHDFSEFEEE